MPERANGAVSKTAVCVSGPGVRIPLSPPFKRPLMIDDKDYRKILKQTWEFWVHPEIQHMKKRGVFSPSSKVYAFQVLFPGDDRSPFVRLNNEVNVCVRLKTGEDYKIGDDVELKNVERLKLHHEEEDWGHITFIRGEGAWYGDFNFVYNKSVAREHLEAASEFLQAATLSYENKLWRPVVDNCYSSIELLMKVQLLLIAQLNKGKKTGHQGISTIYNRIFRGSSSTSLLNELSGLRPKARYLKNKFSLGENKAADYLKLIKKEMTYLEHKL